MIVTDITKIGDPQILLHDGTYYCYATSDKEGFLVWQSDDLITWSNPTCCFKAIDFWGKSHFWAPEVVYHNGKFIMHYTAKSRALDSLRVGVAVSQSPTGPFIDVYNAPMFDFGYAAIDASVLVCDEGNYLYYSRDCVENFVNGVKTSQVYCVMLDDSLTKVIGEPKLMTTPEYDYELKSENIAHLWNEGPCVIFYGGKYLMNYSANYYASNDYAICLAVADKPMGPWRKPTSNPVLSCRKDLFGAGHNAFFCGKDGSLYTSFHVQTNPDNPSGDRRVVIGKVEFSENDGDICEVID